MSIYNQFSSISILPFLSSIVSILPIGLSSGLETQGNFGQNIRQIAHAWWHHQMETFSALLALCAGTSPVTGEFPSQRPVTPGFDVFFDLSSNKRLSKQSKHRWFETPSRSLWRHCNVVGSHGKPWDVFCEFWWSVLRSPFVVVLLCTTILGRCIQNLGCTMCPLWRKNSRYIHFMRKNGVNYRACAIASWLNNDVNNVSCMVARLDWLWDCAPDDGHLIIPRQTAHTYIARFRFTVMGRFLWHILCKIKACI